MTTIYSESERYSLQFTVQTSAVSIPNQICLVFRAIHCLVLRVSHCLVLRVSHCLKDLEPFSHRTMVSDNAGPPGNMLE